MNSSKILITGSAGFIGFHLCKSLLDDGVSVVGVDNLNEYYDVNLKSSRLKILDKYENFNFHKIDISDLEQTENIFEKFRPNKVVNLAAQAGVRYSIENPFTYVNSNLVGFTNVIELCRKYSVKGFIYASSSSVYGKNSKMPFSVDDRTDSPISLYAASKKANELIAHSYSHLFDMKTTGLRFFTVYGPWGRPDMAMYIFIKKILLGEPILVFNNGQMERDFTYIDDIVIGLRKAIEKNYNCEIFNLGNNKTEKLMNVINLIEKKLNKKAIIDFQPIQPGDVKSTYSDIDKSIELLDFQPSTNVGLGIDKFINWYKSYHNIL
tara:strand:+ start:1438 stop:2403 length:966 start_codon:yes stop_codon:yes gene_type:complete